MRFYLSELKVNCDERGRLVAIEGNKDVNFDIKRAFYIYGNDNDLSRAGHANCKSQEVLICLNGSCRVFVDDGIVKDYFILNRPESMLTIETNVWVEVDKFSEGCIILVLASDYYNLAAQIKDYNLFKEMTK